METVLTNIKRKIRRKFIRNSLALTAAATSGIVKAQWTESMRYPDPNFELLDTSFTRYRIFNSSIERQALIGWNQV